LAGLVTTFLLTGAILSCSGGNGDSGAPPGGAPPGGAPATVPAVVFIADNDSDGNKELYVALNDGASVLMLSTGGDVKDFKISPDGSRVAYRADQDTPGVIELYVNSINGGTPVKVHPDFPFGRNVELLPALPANDLDVFSWSPNSAWIAYIADQTSDTVYEIYVAAPDGLSNFKVSGSLVGNGDVIDFEWAPNNSHIAYRADEDTEGVYELYTTTPAATPTLNKVSDLPPSVVPNDVVVPRPGIPNDTAGALYLDAFEWAPDSSVIAYVADQIANDVFELFTVPPDGLAPSTEVSAISGSPFDVLEFKWAPDSSRIAYRADQNTEEIFELFTATPDGSDNDEVSLLDRINIPLSDVSTFSWAPDSSRIAYIANQDTDTVFELYTSSPDGITLPVNVKVSFDPLVLNGNISTFAWAPDSSLIAYLADQDNDTVNELYTSPPDSNTGNTKASFEPLVPGGTVFSFAWAPDSSRIAYRADQDTDNIFELYSSLPDGSVNDKLSGLLTPGGRVVAFEWAPDTSRIAYIADQDTDNVFELFSSQPDGSGNGNISGPLVPNGNVSAFEYQP
jgi:Tol biopolymer transport system component